MNIELEPGKYVVAVSGGVDSAVLLDVLRKQKNLDLVVAHFDHGIRPDSHEDREFVRSLAQKYGLPFEYAEARLGANASEATARAARYKFLKKTMEESGAVAIITAHHEDDALETAIINILRGTGRKGLSALGDRSDVRRPLLGIPKSQLLDYARKNNLEWHEDDTNNDENYLRNYVRRRLLPKFSAANRQDFLHLIERSRANNKELDIFLIDLLGRQNSLGRRWFSQLPHGVALEVMAAWLRRHDVRSFDSKTLERLVVAAKTGRSGQHFDVNNGTIMEVREDKLALDIRER